MGGVGGGYHVLQHLQRVVEIVLMRPAIALLHDVQSSHFWQYNLQQTRALQVFKAYRRVWCHHDFVQLHLDALATDYSDAVSHATESVERLVLYLEIQLGGKANATHHTQRVVRERHLRVQGCGNDAILQVGNAVEGIHQFSEPLLIQTDSHRIDGEVATVLVVLQRAVLHDGLARIVAVALLAGTHELNLYFRGER